MTGSGPSGAAAEHPGAEPQSAAQHFSFSSERRRRYQPIVTRLLRGLFGTALLSLSVRVRPTLQDKSVAVENRRPERKRMGRPEEAAGPPQVFLWILA